MATNLTSDELDAYILAEELAALGRPATDLAPERAAIAAAGIAPWLSSLHNSAEAQAFRRGRESALVQINEIHAWVSALSVKIDALSAQVAKIPQGPPGPQGPQGQAAVIHDPSAR